MSESEYSLASSKRSLGELVPILYAVIDGEEEIIDGYHRLGESPGWHKQLVPQITTREQLEAARLAVNFNRRQVAPDEIASRIAVLAETLKPEEIMELTGMSRTTVYKYLPQEFKDPKRVDAGRKGGQSTVSIFAPPAEQNVIVKVVPDDVSVPRANHTVTVSDTVHFLVSPPPIDGALADALEGAHFPRCPTCGDEAVSAGSLGLPYVVCAKSHEWHLLNGNVFKEPESESVSVLQEPTSAPQPAKTGTFVDVLKLCPLCHIMYDVNKEPHICTPLDSQDEEPTIDLTAEPEAKTPVLPSVPKPSLPKDPEIIETDTDTTTTEETPKTQETLPSEDASSNWLSSLRLFSWRMERQIQRNTAEKGLLWRSCDRSILTQNLTDATSRGRWIDAANYAFMLAERDGLMPAISATDASPQTTVTCGCGQEIAIVSDFETLTRTIKEHANNCLLGDCTLSVEIERSLLRDVLMTLYGADI